MKNCSWIGTPWSENVDSAAQCPRGHDAVNEDRGWFDVRVVNTFLWPFLVSLFYVSSQLRIATPAKTSTSHCLQSPPPVRFNCFCRFYKISNPKDKMLTCSLEKCSICLHKNTHPREEAAPCCTHHHSSLEDLHLQLETSHTEVERFSQALHSPDYPGIILSPPFWTASCHELLFSYLPSNKSMQWSL